MCGLGIVFYGRFYFGNGDVRLIRRFLRFVFWVDGSGSCLGSCDYFFVGVEFGGDGGNGFFLFRFVLRR